jgi:hypothetical protein
MAIGPIEVPCLPTGREFQPRALVV